jgi:glycosyltransferase involved in cell wall biosynthesis
MDEEPYNLATYLALGIAQRLGIPALFFTWQNLLRNYPPPFAWWERANYRRAAYALAGNQDAAAILRSKGYSGPITVLPQFGVDPAIFINADASRHSPTEWHSQSVADAPLRIGYAGGLLPEKGLDLLLQACASLQGEWQLRLVGEGESRAGLVALAANLGIADRVRFDSRLESHAMPTSIKVWMFLSCPAARSPLGRSNLAGCSLKRCLALCPWWAATPARFPT